MDTLNKSLEKNIAASHVETTAESMSDEEFFKAEKVFIKECVEGGAGNMIQTGTKLQFKPSPDHVSLSQTKASPSVDARSQNTSNHVTAGTASMETAVDKHRDISRRPCPDASRHAETHKIKLSYKSLAAIPTNTLLLDQQAIDEQVERGESPCDMTDGGVTLDRGVVDTHAEMCSPAQLRQQSEELYAVIDEILANSIPESKASRSLQSSRSSTPGLQQNTSSSPKSLGRETKYASLCSLHPPTSLERNLIDRKKTKPGVIRPMTAIPRLTVDDEEEFHPNPFRQFNDKRTFTDNSKVVARKDLHTSSKGRMWREERKPERRTPFSVCDLQITEPEDQISRPVKTSFSPTEGRLEAFETHI
uniref:Uncharacterized protein n=1 Tax=Sparus aurata TaxID=8175 RepID=A0A671YNH6_SPAAU